MCCFKDYAERLHVTLDDFDWTPVKQLLQALVRCQQSGNRVFLCGNGGSAANAIHIANDFIYGSALHGKGIRALALTANISVITCIGNDIDYANIFSYQLATQGEAGDVLIALSGSGNSDNIVQSIKHAQHMGIQTFALLGYSGGACKEIADVSIHFSIDDMQIAEDLQLIVGHMLMQQLRENNMDMPIEVDNFKTSVL